ncbi:MAG TPA: hypothetical protein VFB79_03110, partial [Candidatus Angelobacter sp.]|nr:hypothetical protein [Candidatus Angelobacter sp.]
KQQLEFDKKSFAAERKDAQQLLNAYHDFQLAVVEMDKKTSARVAELKAQLAQKVQSYERTITNLQAELSNARVELAKAKSENSNLRAELAKAKQPNNNKPQTVALVQPH